MTGSEGALKETVSIISSGTVLNRALSSLQGHLKLRLRRTVPLRAPSERDMNKYFKE